MKTPSPAAVALAEKINRVAEDDFLTIERLATLIDESNRELVEAADEAVKYAGVLAKANRNRRLEFSETPSNFNHMVGPLSNALANHQPTP